jgi:hypothetical protein
MRDSKMIIYDLWRLNVLIYHAMNVIFAKDDGYGSRSYRICSYEKEDSIVVFTPGVDSSKSVDSSRIRIKLTRAPVSMQLRRYAYALLKNKKLKLQMIGAGYDEALSSAIERTEALPQIFHTWEWVPKSIQIIKRKNPKVKIIRDVVVNRFNEFYSGVPIIEENEYVDYFFSPSSYSTRFLETSGIPRSKIIEIPFGVDVDLFKPIVEKTNNPIRFCFSGGISRRKGIDSLLRVWGKKPFKDAELHLYGKIRDGLEKSIHSNRNVFCHGHIPLYDELPMNHIFVFPSTLEGSAKSVYEAMACGLPVITTPESGSVVRDSIDGFIIEKGNDGALLAAMNTLYADEQKRKEMSVNARKRAIEFTWERYARSVWDAYRRVI